VIRGLVPRPWFAALPRWTRWGWLGLWLVLIPLASAHRPSDGWIQLTVTNRSITLRLDLALKDLDAVLGLDTSDDGNLTWGELRRRETDLTEYVTRRLTLTNAAERLLLVPEPLRLVNHEEVVCASLFFTAQSDRDLRELTLTYRCLFELDPQHRALVQAEWAGAAVSGGTMSGTNQLLSAASYTGLLSPSEPSVTFFSAGSGGKDTTHPSPTGGSESAFLRFFHEGVHHIWTGYDHLLFLLALLLPSVLARGSSAWEPLPAFRPALVTVLQVVTAFTLAHSLTLGLAAFGLARPPSRFIESAIAASVLYAALSNLWIWRPRPSGKRSFAPADNDARPDSSSFRRALAFAGTIPFVFGLIHGFGFANALGELGLSGRTLVVPLIAFNVGVEAGQLACVAVFLPVAFGLRASSFYRRGVLPVGSVLIALVAGAWFVDRAFNLGFMPF